MNPSRAPRLLVVLLLSCLPVWQRSEARAQEQQPAADEKSQQELDDDRARAHYLAGESHFAAERWEDASREFALAYELSRRPEMLINLSRAHERQGALAEAIGDLEHLLANYPESSYRLEAEQRIGIMRAKLAVPPVAEEEAPVPAAAPVAPVKRRIWPPRWPTLAVGGVAIAAGVVALATGLKGHSIHNDLEGRCPGAACPAGFEEDRDRGRALSRASTALTFVSIALAGTTAALWVVDVKRERKSISVGLNGGGAQLQARF